MLVILNQLHNKYEKAYNSEKSELDLFSTEQIHFTDMLLHKAETNEQMLNPCIYFKKSQPQIKKNLWCKKLESQRRQ